MSRKKDPKTSHTAARDLVDRGHHGRQKLAALALVKKYPGYTYRHLYDRHVAESKRRGRELGLDLAAVKGRGPAGRVQFADVEAAAAEPVAAKTITPVAERLAADLGVDWPRLSGSGVVQTSSVCGTKPAAAPA